MRDDELLSQAERAALAWGEPAAPLCLLARRENSVFELRLADGRHGALRLHRVGYQTSTAIEAELAWMEALADAGFACPRPIPTREGAFIGKQAFGPMASLLGWVDGRALSATRVDAAAMRRLGRLLAELHATTDGLRLGRLDRPHWDADGLLGEAPLWGRFWENPALSEAEAAELITAREAARARLGGDFGLIHADVLGENVIVAGERMALIDFDDCGYGWRGYDLGSALVQHWDDPDLPALREALAEGYAERRGLPGDLPLFTALRAMASAGWIMTRAPADDPLVGHYARRALGCMRAAF